MILWVVRAFLVLFFAGVAYTLAGILLAWISPGTIDRLKERQIAGAAKRYFGFLLAKGYRIVDVRYIAHNAGHWHVRLESQDGGMSYVLDEQDGFSLVFGREGGADRQQVYLGALIHHLTDGQVMIDSLDRTDYSMQAYLRTTAGLIRKYHDRMAGFTHKKPLELKKELSDMGSKYALVLSRRFDAPRRGTG
jgi:hypothetical protein